MATYNKYEVPTPEQVVAALNVVARLAEASLPEGWCFIFLAATKGEGGSLAYISNVERDSALQVLREFITKHSDA